MYIKNRRDSSNIKAFGSYQTLCLTESLVLRNRLLFIYKHVVLHAKKPTAQTGTFGFARHTSRPFAKPKEPFFCHRTDIVPTEKLILTNQKKNIKL